VVLSYFLYGGHQNCSLFCGASRTALGPTLPYIQFVRCCWEVGGGMLFPWRLSNRNLNLTSHFSILPRLGMRGVAPSLPHASS
jgi:hypothetical protein